MASGELPPWARGVPDAAPPADPYAYHGPWGPPVPGAADQASDEVLRRLPPPSISPPSISPPSISPPSTPPPWPADVSAGAGQRPVLVGLAVTLAVTASLLWVSALSLVVLVALAGTQQLQAAGDTGVVFHTLDQVVLRLGDGLWVPLYGFPLVAVVTGFLLLTRRPWARVTHSVVGVATLGWAGWWLRGSLLGWVVVAVYVGLSVAVLWAPSVGRWYAGRPRPTAQQLSA